MKKILADVPDSVPVVIEQVYDSIPPDHLGPDEYDDYGGMPTGKFDKLTNATYDLAHGHILLRFM